MSSDHMIDAMRYAIAYRQGWNAPMYIGSTVQEVVTQQVDIDYESTLGLSRSTMLHIMSEKLYELKKSMQEVAQVRCDYLAEKHSASTWFTFNMHSMSLTYGRVDLEGFHVYRLTGRVAIERFEPKKPVLLGPEELRMAPVGLIDDVMRR